MFNQDFYPTPDEVLDMMQIDCVNKTVLEPSAGKGNIVDYLIRNGAKSVIMAESEHDLRSVLIGKGYSVGHKDFLEMKPDDVSHIDLIVMNPPFSKAAKHINHAITIAPDGCEIISLCNSDSFNDRYSREWMKVQGAVEDNGYSTELGDVFRTAERTTNVNISLLKIFKPIESTEDINYDGFFMEDDEEEDRGAGIMEYNEVRAIVNRYVGAMKLYDSMHDKLHELSELLSAIGVDNLNLTIGRDESVLNKGDFSKQVQKLAWKHIFRKMKLEKYVTRGVMKDINKFVEQQTNIPFTMRNVYRMFEIIVGTREQQLAKSLEEVIDYFTRYTAENRWNVEGWKTNSGHMLNRKFIIDHIVELSWGGKLGLVHSSQDDRLDDLTKVMCNLTATNYDNIGSIRSYFHLLREKGDIERGKWYSWGFFELKCFNKGSMHLKFKDKDQWVILNREYARLKGFTLPEVI